MFAFQALLHLLVLPSIFLVWLAAGRQRSRLQWIALAALAASHAFFIVIIGPWGWVGYSLWIVLLLVLAAALIVSYRRCRSAPWRPPPSWKVRIDLGIRLSLALLFSAGAAYGLSGYRAPERAVDLDFPLRGGVFLVGQGGSNPLVNYHNVSASQRYALDILALNAAGLRAWGLYPSTLGRYAIFGDSVVSPCAGQVIRATDGLPDHSPPARDPERPAGNSVILACGGSVIYLAHLREGSVRVAAGDRVQAGDALGRVGNSGNTSEPHLHIHAERGPYTGESGPGVAMRFNGRFLVRNSLVW
jgi:hypothetical protein